MLAQPVAEIEPHNASMGDLDRRLRSSTHPSTLAEVFVTDSDAVRVHIARDSSGAGGLDNKPGAGGH